MMISQTFKKIAGLLLLINLIIFIQLVGVLNCEVSDATDDESDTLDHTVEAVTFCPHMPNIAVTATLAGFVTIWDVSSKVSIT